MQKDQRDSRKADHYGRRLAELNERSKVIVKEDKPNIPKETTPKDENNLESNSESPKENPVQNSNK